MRKGIATIIATIILVVITIGLISTAYIYFASIVTVGPVLSSMTVPRCKRGIAWFDTVEYPGYNITIYLKNEGTDSWNDITFLYDGSDLDPDCLVGADCTSVDAGTQESCLILSNKSDGAGTQDCEFDPSGTHMITAIGPKNQVAIPVTC